MTVIGNIALFLAFPSAIYSAFAYIYGTKKKHAALVESARHALLAVTGLVSVAAVALLYALVTHDFQLEYVSSYTNLDLSLSYRLAAFWAGNAGSLMFWALLLGIFAAVFVLQKRRVGKELTPYAASVIMLTEAFFLLILLFVSPPFHKLPFVPADGRGLNPMLENPGMFFHPPLLLAGYVGFTIPFAVAIAALVTRRLSDEWITMVRRWTLLTWIFLTIGNLLGAWWAYVELGWGGYWAWDPVENASFMPWLVATAFLHSIMMQRRRGILRVWNIVLIVLTFNLAILGTFLTRSGVLSSVHAFAESPILGMLFLVFIGISLFAGLGLLYLRMEDLKSEAEIESLVSRESTFLINNLLLVGAAFTIFLGTFFPVISEAVRGVKVTVGPPFFNQVNAPIFLAIILLAGICTLIGWRQASTRNLVRNFLGPFIAALGLGVALFIFGVREWYALIVFTVCGFVIATILYEWFRGTRARNRIRNENYLKAFFNLIRTNRPRYGGYIVHLAVILIAVGIAGSSIYNVEKEVDILPSESFTINDYTLTYENIDYYETESKTVVATTLSVANHGGTLGKLIPEKYFHQNYEQSVTEVAIRSTVLEDLYVILVGWDNTGMTSFKVIVNPLVKWIWLGGILLVFGALVAFWPEKEKQPAAVRKAAGRK